MQVTGHEHMHIRKGSFELDDPSSPNTYNSIKKAVLLVLCSTKLREQVNLTGGVTKSDVL